VSDDLIQIDPNQLRSKDWFRGEPKTSFIHRSWMKNQGVPDHEFNGKPVIGICNTWSDLDPARGRAGLPAGVAALVERLEARRTVVQLVNTDAVARTVVVQGGGYGEHAFTKAAADGGEPTALGGTTFAVRLAAGSTVRLDLATRPHVCDPSYSFPLAGDPGPRPAAASRGRANRLPSIPARER
jgi:hypothetical protein